MLGFPRSERFKREQEGGLSVFSDLALQVRQEDCVGLDYQEVRITGGHHVLQPHVCEPLSGNLGPYEEDTSKSSNGSILE